MATTLKANMFVPQVATAMATAVFPDELALRFAGTPFVRVIPEDRIGNEGDTVTFPRFDVMSDFADLTENTAMSPDTLTTSTDTATVFAGGSAAEVTDFASLSGRGNPSAEIGRQFARKAAEYLDSKLITEAYTTSLDVNAGATFSYDALVDAIFGQWGDKALANVGGLVVHSKVAGDIMKAAEFATADKAGPGLNTAVHGFLGQVAGMPIYISDRLNVDTAPTPDEYDCLVLKRGALGLMFQRELLIEYDRDVLNKSDIIAADVRAAVHLFYDNPSPVIEIAWQ